MAFGNPHGRRGQAPVGEINMVPLIDVMLVLVVIFLVTAPLLGHAVKIELPRAESAPDETPPPGVLDLALDADGRVFLDDRPVNEAQLAARFAAAAARQPMPELHIRADRNTRYERIAQLMSQAAQAGLGRIGFVSDPRSGRPPSH